MSDQPTILFHDGNSIPQVGLGVWQTPNETAVTAVKAALATGYRHVDTAAIYENEEGVGEGIRASGVARSEIFLTTKLCNSDQGYDASLKALDASLKRLCTDYVDLYLIHWPA
ncbi:MAG: aldo/keto reductase, partial [Rhizobiales bacterium]|nr:aldo/keto reductase [Hyphomicrobiales bacterium]